MATTAADPVFVDTNVLVYAQVQQAPLNALAVHTLQTLRAAGTQLWISRQVLREYLAVLTRPQTFVAPQAATVLAADIAYFQTHFLIAEDSAAVTSNLLSLLTQIPLGGKQIHDANIVATMQAYSLPRLLTHNVADFSRFAGLITVLPL